MPYISVNNINIHYETHGKGEPILFIHGLGSSVKDWENQINYFASSFQVIALDLRGHGNSDKPTTPYTIALFTQDVAKFIQAIGLEKVNIVGHSLGGMIAFQLALDFPELVQTLTIINSGPAVVFPSFTFYLNFYFRVAIIKLFGVGLLSRMLANKVFPEPDQEPLRQQFIERWSKNDAKAYLNTMHAFSGWTVIDRLLELQCPTLIIAADKDYTSVANKEAYAKHIKNSELVIIENSRHMTLVDKPLALNQALWNFLQRNNKKNAP